MKNDTVLIDGWDITYYPCGTDQLYRYRGIQLELGYIGLSSLVVI